MPVSRFFEGLGASRYGGNATDVEDQIEDVLATPEGAQLISLFASIKNPRVRKRVVELVRALSEEAGEGKRG
jgi:hypothetical protein